ncbi:MAG: tetrahydromethanopterin:alpha-L-glutamate ligase [Desulfovibrionales bacterium]|jgi:ribosomal protein S6--L-glutamate ligase|nr:tetrahydromethanopterin:alpha-L-glutamate ligase [Desulfovibrionales bacterium]
MIKIAVVGAAGGWSSETLADAVERKTGFRLLVEMDQVRLDLPSGRAFYKGHDLSEMDAILVKKVGARYSPDLLDRLEVLRLIAEKGAPILSDPCRIMRVLDRLSCTVTLQLSGIPMPPTTITEDVDEALAAVERYGETVFKPLYSNKAKGMIMLTPAPGVREKISEYHAEHPIMYLQQKIELGNEDLGLVFLGGEYLCCYTRLKKGGPLSDLRSGGGKYELYKPTKEILDLADKAQKPFGLDFTCVDVALTPDGPVIFEVSAFGGFRGVTETTGIDAAERFVDLALSRIEQ